jgi:UDP-galactopyranose mutase
MAFSSCNLIIVGAGFFGLTIAHQAATKLGLKVLVLERRDHSGGNAHSALDPETGIETHVYGSHLFHCNSEEIWRYLNGFTPFTDYRHHVLSVHRGKIYPMPINLGTICSFFGRKMTPDEARALIASQCDEMLAMRGGHNAFKSIVSPMQPPVHANLEDKAVALIGRPLYEAFIRGYTAKQWQTDPKLLPPDIITRLPVRFTFNTRYFDDRFEGLPSEGYARIFERMANHPNIDLRLKADFFAVREQLPKNVPVIYTGPIDRYFDERFGALSWRTLDFEREVVATGDYQGAPVINYADEDIPYTRIHEFRHLHPERNYQREKTVIFREYARFAQKNDEPYYPVNTAQDKDLYAAYRSLAAGEKNVIFGGRLGSYRYLDMHQAIGSALKLFMNALEPHFTEAKPIDTKENDE